ncbi:MAG: chromate transporter [Candidatus Gastranaerophilales bacterium]|nr:chromate transporter [Candidatus Gastranaerophilales bacterium]MCM1072651.1 chromate transporter [Bacteroides sp.]
MIYLHLILEFFKIGLFSFGGGYATIPFLYHISEVYHWYSLDELTQMVAVASITPGPVGINVATYAGLKSAGILGSLLATTAEMLPSLFLVIIVSKLLKKFSDNFYVKSIIETLKPISCALLTAVAIGLLKPSLGDIKAMILLAFLLILSWKSKKDPLFYIILSAVIGIIISILQ